MNSSEVIGLLRGRFSPPSWALLEEVRDGTGYATAGRSMDAMAFGLWPSRGLEIHGFEIKVYRNDWLRELKQPEKAESFYKYVDRWWIVAGDDTIVKVDELPQTWGLLVGVKGEKLKVVKEAPVKKPTPINRLFMMAIIRRITEHYVPKRRVDDAIAKQVAQKIEDAVHNAVFGRDALKRENDTLRAAIADFEKRSGVQITEWNHEHIGEAVKVVMDHGPDHILNQYEYLGRRMRELGEEIEKRSNEAKTKLDGLKVVV